MSDYERRRFEAWARSQGYNVARASAGEGSYDVPFVHYMWLAWKASTAVRK